MKEYPEANYFLKIWETEVGIDPQMAHHLPSSYLIQVNLIVRIVLVPWLPPSPWPPPYPTDWDHWGDRDEAARYLFATSTVTVAPMAASTPEPQREVVIFDEYPETQHTVFWLPSADYEALLADVVRAFHQPRTDLLRLNDLDEGPLVKFLKEEVPKAALGTYERKILCLEPLPELPTQPATDPVST